jgi:hypothetical protein
MSEDQKRQLESQLWGIANLIGRNFYLIQDNTFLTTINTEQLWKVAFPCDQNAYLNWSLPKI